MGHAATISLNGATKRVQPEMEHLQNIPNLKLEDFAWKFNENGIFYCENVDSPAGRAI